MISKRVMELLNVTHEEFDQWCSIYNKNPNRKKTQQDFLDRIREGRLVRENGVLKNKHREEGNNE